MKKYLGLFALVFLLSILVDFKHQQYADNATANRGTQGPKVSPNEALPTGQHPSHPKSRAEQWWDRGYLFFGWPNGISIWALFLTLIVIAEQTMETRKAAQASVKAAHSSVKQARLARKTLILQFRPKIIVRGGGVTNAQEVLFLLTNTGGAMAHISFLNLRFVVRSGAREEWIKDIGNQVDGLSKFRPGEMKSHRVHLEDDVVAAIGSRIRETQISPSIHETRIYCIGIVRYLDDLKIERATGLYRKYNPRTDRFEPVQGSDAEYAD